jgi:hypothetical protein
LLCFAFFDRVDAGCGFVEAGVTSRAGTVTLRSCVRSGWEHAPVILFDLSSGCKEAHTFDLRFRHELHAASVCLRFSFEDCFGPGLVCSIVVDSGGEIDVVMAVGNNNDNDDGGEYLCKN